MRTGSGGIMRLFEHVVVLCLAVMVVLVFGNVVLRYVFNSGISFSEEIARLLFVWLTFIGAVVAMRDQAHLGLDALVTRLPRAGRLACLVIGHLLMLFCCALLVVGSWKQTVINLDNAMPVSGWPVGLMYAAGLVCGVSIGVLLLVDLGRALCGRLGDDDLVQVHEQSGHAPMEVAK